MCSNCHSGMIGRRHVLKYGMASLVAIGLGAGTRVSRAASGPATTLIPDEALVALKSGNQRYLNDPQVCTLELAKRREEVALASFPTLFGDFPLYLPLEPPQPSREALPAFPVAVLISSSAFLGRPPSASQMRARRVEDSAP
jgi:hypothetical protein